MNHSLTSPSRAWSTNAAQWWNRAKPQNHKYVIEVADQSFRAGWNACYDQLSREGPPTLAVAVALNKKTVAELQPCPPRIRRAKFTPGVAGIAAWEASDVGKAYMAKEAERRNRRRAPLVKAAS